VLGFAGAGSVLAAASFALVPSWPLDFLYAARHYMAVAPTSPAIMMAAQAVLPEPTAWATAAASAAVLVAWAITGWRGQPPAAGGGVRGRKSPVPSPKSRADEPVAIQGVCRTLTATALLVPPAWETNAVILLLPLAATLARLPSRTAAAWFVAASAAVSALDIPLYLTLGWHNGTVLIFGYAALLAATDRLIVVSRRSSPAAGVAAPSAQG
ncbi:MAG: hypothetical protein ACRDI2_07870, partial [Chloroflexota bacterium]